MARIEALGAATSTDNSPSVEENALPPRHWHSEFNASALLCNPGGVQGLTGREGSFHAGQMIEYGTTVIAGVTPGKGGTKHENVHVFNTVSDAVRETGAEGEDRGADS